MLKKNGNIIHQYLVGQAFASTVQTKCGIYNVLNNSKPFDFYVTSQKLSHLYLLKVKTNLTRLSVWV